MFDRDVDYPTPVASYYDDDVTAAIDWCVEHMQKGDTLSVWTALKSNLRNCPQATRFTSRFNRLNNLLPPGSRLARLVAAASRDALRALHCGQALWRLAGSSSAPPVAVLTMWST